MKPGRIRASLTILAVLFSVDILAICTESNVVLQVLGSGGPELDDDRASASYLIWQDGRASVLVDVGGGSSLNFERANARLTDLKAIALTHLHVDHSADFPTLIKGSYFTERKTQLPVFGPDANDLMPSTIEFVSAMLGEEGAYPYLSDHLSPRGSFLVKATNIPFTRGSTYSKKLDEALKLSAVSVHHGPVAALAWRVDIADCSIVFSGDMSNQYRSLERLAKNADILVAHNAVPESASGIARRLHMPPSEIGQIAARAGVRKLVLSHRMQRTLGREQQTRNQISASYSGPIEFADDLDSWPVLIR